MSETKKSVLEFLRQNNMRKLWQTTKVKIGEENIKSIKSRTQKGGYSKCVHMRTRGRQRD